MSENEQFQIRKIKIIKNKQKRTISISQNKNNQK